MPWCPKCRNEYVEGKTHCPDCDVDLVEELSFEKEEILPPEDYEFPEDFRPEEVLNGPKERPKPVRTYKSPEERYKDARSSAGSFLLVGGAGFILMILALAGILSFPFHDFALISMLIFFGVFLGIGVFSLKNSRKIRESMEEERTFVEKVSSWFETQGKHQERIKAVPSDLPEEIRYFELYDAVRRTLTERFPEMDEALLDKLTSDFCEEN